MSNIFYNSSNEHFYQVIDANLTWVAAQADASSKTYVGLSGYLVEIGSAAENYFVSNLLGDRYAWIGATDDAEEGVWRWKRSGELVTYSNWYLTDNQPDNSGNADYAVLMGSSYPDIPLVRSDVRGAWDDGGVS